MGGELTKSPPLTPPHHALRIGERSDAVLRTAMGGRGNRIPFSRRGCARVAARHFLLSSPPDLIRRSMLRCSDERLRKDAASLGSAWIAGIGE